MAKTLSGPLVTLVAIVTIAGASPLAAGLEAQPSTEPEQRLPVQISNHLAEVSDHPQTPQEAVDAQQRKLETTKTLLSALDGRADDLEAAVELAALGIQHRDAGQGSPADLVNPSHEFQRPSQALSALADLYGTALTDAQRSGLTALDVHPAADELERVVEAFLALDTATRNIAPPSPTGVPTVADVDRDPVFTAQTHLLDAVVALEAALEGTGGSTSSSEPTLAVPPAFAIDLDGTATTYTAKTALTIDVGGDDAYHNNAGGSHVLDGTCNHLDDSPHWAAGALVDLGRGTDEYGDPADPMRCGVNGGGHSLRGTGFLLDGGGNDAYTAAGPGTNGGGGGLGMGFLLDVGGDDRYVGGSGGTNGGADSGGVGFLLDAAGHDSFFGWYGGINGGGGGDTGLFGPLLTASGFLVDAEGDDSYRGFDEAINGGAEGRSHKGIGGDGFLLDGDGNDSYVADDHGTNGGGHVGSGFLYDRAGDDRYRAGDNGANGGGVLGVGTLVDGSGDDHYVAENRGAPTNNGVNGGAGDDPRGEHPDARLVGLGLLYDGQGTDAYEGDQGGAGTDRTVVPKGTVGAQIDGPLGTDEVDAP